MAEEHVPAPVNSTISAERVVKALKQQISDLSYQNTLLSIQLEDVVKKAEVSEPKADAQQVDTAQD